MGNNLNYTIKDLPEEERPREKLYKHGAKTLTNAELLAIIIRTGNKENTAIELSQRILTIDKKGISFFIDSSIEELTTINGVGKCKAAQILAAVELGKRICSISDVAKYKISSPQDVANLVMEQLRSQKKEYFKTILLDTKNQVISIEDISVGSLNSSIVHPREVFKIAIKRSSASIILIHNHPSGDPTPSSEDINITKRLVDSGKILGIEVLDHVIIGDKKYLSFKEKNLI